MKLSFWAVLALLLLPPFHPLFAQNELLINESFASGIPDSWIKSGVSATSYGGKSCASMSSGAILQISGLPKAGSITISHRASGNGKTLSLEKSVDGKNWVSVGTASPSSASSWGSSTFSINEGGNIDIRLTASSATIYITDIQISTLPDPILKSNISAFDFGTVFSGEFATKSITIDGNYLSGDVSAKVTGQGYSISQNLSSSTSSIIIGKTDLPTSITIKYESPIIPTGSVIGSLTLSSNGAADLSIVLSAFSSATVPTLITNPVNLNFGYLLYGQVSPSKTFILSGKYLQGTDKKLILEAKGDYLISLNDIDFSSSATLDYSKLNNTFIYVRFVPKGNIHKQSIPGSIEISGGGTSNQISLQGFGVTTYDDIAMHYYISPSGNDQTGDGSLTKPWYSLTKAIDLSQAGDTIHCRGGKYGLNSTVRLEKSGLPQKRIAIFAYQDDFGNFEYPVFDFSSQPYGANNRGFLITGDYWYLFGIHITHAGDNGVKLEGNHCIIERCTFSYNGDTGIQLGFGHNFSDSHPGISSNDGSHCSYNVIVDCDSYQNYDQDNYGSDADGFACKMHNGKENWFIRCRAWNNSDDAWDLYETDYPVYIIECWAWHSGDASQHPVSGGSFQGNGNGIKMGGNGSGGSSEGKHEVWNSIAFNCNKTGSVKGFDQNSHKGGVKVVNCLAFNNGYDFMFEDAPSGTTNDFYNNVCLSNRLEINTSNARMENNVAINNPQKGWTSALNLNFSSADYNDLSETAAKNERASDGALPKSFGRLLSRSQLIDKGKMGLTPPLPTFLDQPLYGNALVSNYQAKGLAKDLGPYEAEGSIIQLPECKSADDPEYIDLDKDNLDDSCDESVIVLSVSSPIQFPGTTIGESSKQTITIANIGKTDGLQILTIETPEGFSTNNFTGTLNAGASKLIEISFVPTHAKYYDGLVTIKSNHGNSTIHVSGIGKSEELVTSMNEFEFDFFPNPAFESVRISVTDSRPEANLKIVGIDGKIWIWSPIKSSDITFDISYLPPGIYLVEIETSNDKYRKKLIKR